MSGRKSTAMKKTKNKKRNVLDSKRAVNCAPCLHLNLTCFNKRGYDIQLVCYINMKRIQARFKCIDMNFLHFVCEFPTNFSCPDLKLEFHSALKFHSNHLHYVCLTPVIICSRRLPRSRSEENSE